ncbi:MAG TPA: autotransporter-associated beta strand repeat-containing protein, partial [Thermoguttaceae bacterium]|nr:autotransporter-associated beta strand repeat-containing protein [Thermoguttaceae bacterium]
IAVNNVGNGTVTIGSNASGAAGKYVVFSGTITLNNKDLHLKGVNVDRTTFTGKITGTGNLYIDGPQRITASYNGNDFVGDVFITAGTFQIDTGANVIPDTSNVTVASGATLRIWGKSEAINGLNGAGTVQVEYGTTPLTGTLTVGAANGSGSFSGTLRDAGTGVLALVKAGSGTQTLSGNNTYTGTTTIRAGTLLLGHPNALGTATSTVQLGDSGTGDNNIALLTDVWAGQEYYNPFAISRNISVNNVGAGTVTIGSNAAGAGPGYWVEFRGTITLNNKDMHLKGANTDRTTFTGKITGTGNVYIDGPQRITWTGPNDFTGNVYITAGTLQVHGNNIPDTADVTVASGATFLIWAASEAINGLNGAGNVQLGGSAQTLTVGAANGSGAFSGTLAQVSGGVLSLLKAGSGTQTLTGPLNYTGGTTVNAGTLVLAMPGLGWTTNGQFGFSGHVITVNAGATLQLTQRGLLGNGQSHQLIINGGTVEFLHETYQSRIEMTGGRIVSTASNYWRVGNWGNGQITVKASSTSSTIEQYMMLVKTASATKTTFDVEDGPAAQDLIVSANIIDHGDGYEGMELVKAGAGTMVLSGTNTYIGPTTIQAGKLLLMGTHTPATTPGLYTVAAGGTLGGTGRTNAPVQVQGTIAPGASVGTIYTGSETWASGGTYQWEIQDVDAGPGTGWDLVNITGTLSITATAAQPFVIDVVSLGGGGGSGLVADFNPLGVYSWEIARTTDGVVDFAAEKFLVDLGDFQNYWHGGRWWVSQQGNSVFLNYAIPEPSSGLLALVALAGLGLWRWITRK